MQNVRNGSTALDANDICRECGICCDGVLFTRAIVSNSEAKTLSGLDVKIEQDSTNKKFINLPCSHFIEGGCSIYKSRPEKCSSYSCILQLEVMNGSIPLSEALKIVSLVKNSRLWIEKSLGSVMTRPIEDVNFRTLIRNYHKVAAAANEQNKLSEFDKNRIKKIFEHIKLIDRFFEKTALLKKYAGLIQNFKS